MRAKEGAEEFRELLHIADGAGLVRENERRWLRETGLLH